MSTSTAIELASVIVCILWNGFFVAAEYAFVSVRRTRLDELVEQGNRRARQVRKITSDPSNFISAMQLGITLSSIALGALGEPAVARVIESALGKPPEGIVKLLSVLAAFALISVLHVVIGEIVPKSYTLPRAESVALFVAPPIRVFFLIFGPFIRFLDWLSQMVMRGIGITPTDELENAHSEAELRMLVRHSERSGLLEAEEQEMIDKVFDFSDTSVEEVMVPRPDVISLPVSLTPAEAIDVVLKHPFTRYPVYGENFDDVLGVLHVRRLYASLQNGGASEVDLRGVLRPVQFVPETKKLGRLLAEIRREKAHMAVVVDEYGSVAGIVTLEDLLEEIVGEIDDEFDPADAPVVRLGPDRYRIDGGLSVEDFNERFDRDLPDEDYHTVGGVVFGELGQAPKPGDTVEVAHVRAEVATVEGTRIQHVTVTLLPRPVAVNEDD